MKKKISGLTLYILLCVIIAVSGSIGALSAAAQVRERSYSDNAAAEIEEIFHDQGYIYMNPIEPKTNESVTIRIRTARGNVTNAQIQYSADGADWKTAEMRFDKVDETGYFDYWTGKIPPMSEAYYYRFIAGNDVQTVFVSRDGTNKVEPSYTSGWYVIPGFSTPDWAKGALVYNLMPSAFYNADTLNDSATSGVFCEVGWGEEDDGLLRYGGDLKGIEEKLDYIKQLGVDIIYMNPIWKSLSGVGYGSTDFDEIDGGFGNEQQLKNFVAAAHKSGLKIVLDAAIENAALGNKLYNSKGYFPLTGAYQSSDSPLTKFFRFLRWPDLFKTDWGCIVFDYSNQITKDYFYAKPDSYIPRYITDYDIDGYRFDVGGDLYGHNTSNIDILKEIRASIKNADSDAVFINEQEYGDRSLSGATDGHWHMQMIYDVRKWIDGTMENDAMARSFKSYTQSIARPMALCCYNIYESHDFLRPYGSTQPNKANILAAQLLCQTYIGASWIYYGAENGQMGGDVRWPGFNWDSTSWDYDFREFQMALSELRKEYSAIRTGIIKDVLVDNKSKLYAFGRWDEKGTVITVTSQNSAVKTAELDVRQLSIADGTVLTDYMTGDSYKVENGKITANIIPGGTALVTGKSAGMYRGKYELSKRTDSIIRTDTDSYYLEGSGRVGGRADKIAFAGTPLYDCASVSATIDEESRGTVYLAMRASLNKNAASYGVTVDKSGKVTLCVRKADGAKMEKTALTEIKSGGSIKIVRTSGNNFQAMINEKSGEAWTAVKNSEVSLEMPNTLYGGFAALNGFSLMNAVTSLNEERAYFDDFESNTAKLPFEALGNLKNCTVENGRLTISTEGKFGAAAVYPPTELNWSAKTAIKGGNKIVEGEYVGLAAASTAGNHISTGRTVIGSKPYIYFGKCENGQMLVIAAVEDTNPDSDVNVQLQKTGARYGAVYSYDEKEWFSLTEQTVFCNYSDEKTGLFSSAKSDIKFEYFSFGDMINTDSSFYTPITPGAAKLYSVDMAQITATAKMKTGAGEWEYAVGGLRTVTKQGIARIDFDEKSFNSFRADATLKLNGESGWAGYAFYQSTAGSSDGYQLRLTADKKLQLAANNEVKAEATLTKEQYEWGRVTLECLNGLITVYAGEDISAVLNYKNDLYVSGYFSFISEDCAASFNNYNVCDLDANWNTRYCTLDYSDGGIRLNPLSTSLTATANLINVAVTDFVMTVKVINSTEKSTGGLRFNVCPEGDVEVYLSDGSVHIERGEENLATLSIDGKPEYVNLTVVSQNGVMRFYVDGIGNMIYELKLAQRHGCTPVMYANGGAVAFTQLMIYGLQPDEDYTQTDVFTAQSNIINSSAISKAVFSENFSDPAATSRNISINSGRWSIADGTLSCSKYAKDEDTVSLNCGKYRDFEMSFRAKITGRYNFLGVLFRKNVQSSHASKNGYALLIDSSGKAFLYPDFDEKTTGDGIIPGFAYDEWVSYRLVVKGTKIQLYASGKLILEAEDDRFSMGYIGLEVMKTTGAFDDIKIIPLS